MVSVVCTKLVHISKFKYDPISTDAPLMGADREWRKQAHLGGLWIKTHTVFRYKSENGVIF